MRPITTKSSGGGGGGAAGTWTPGVVPGMEAGPDGGCARRQYRGRSMAKRGGRRGGGTEAEEEAAQQARVRIVFIFFMQKRND
jgi:hypothetical protein